MKLGFALVAAAFFVSSAFAQEHKMMMPNDLKWDAVPSLPQGAQIAVMEGPMNQAVPFTVRLKFPANYRIPPHHHPAVERVTVLSGTKEETTVQLHGMGPWGVTYVNPTDDPRKQQ
jgi:hypothetical protein